MESIWVLLFRNFAGRVGRVLFVSWKFACYSSENQLKLPIVL
jgi:hypothetical protein